MSKHLLEALVALSHISLLQNVDCENCETNGTLNIHLIDQDEQGNQTDSSDTRYVKVADSSGNSELHILQLHHGEATLCLNNMDGVQAVVVQVDEHGLQLMNGDIFAISYYVNGNRSEDDYATHYFRSCNEDQQLTIINQSLQTTCLSITKVLYDEFHEPLCFEEGMNFVVHVEGMDVCETLDLNMCNGFHTSLHDLIPGTYRIWEEEMDCFDTSYRLDGGEAYDNDCELQIVEGQHELDVINTKRTGSVLTLDKYIRGLNGELMKPQEGECFHIRVIGDYYDQVITLNYENDFAFDILNLPNGYYDVSEVDCAIYDVTYLVNAEKENDYAHVEVRECEASSVLIINNPRMTCEQDSPLRICKYVRRSDGCLVKPDPCLCFKVMLSGCGVCETFNLNASNNFCVDIEHICCGEYEIRELDHENYVCSYMVNDDCETTQACLCIHEGGRNCVRIINEERNKGEVSICKVIRDSCGDLSKPDKSARFLVTLRSFFCRETFVLDASNDFCIHASNLKEGSYEVRERRVDGYDTTYSINGGKEERKARFLVENGCCNDIKVVNSLRREIEGDLRICKYISNPFGDYVKPAVDEEFEIHVQGPCMDTCYILRPANNWCVVLEGLKKGVYRVQETSSCDYTTQYFVNGCEMEEALVCMDKENQEVEIINTRRNFGNIKLSALIQTCDNDLVKPCPNERFEVLIESASDSRLVVLDACNNFGILLEDMGKGKYRITQKDTYGYMVCYEVDGERMSNAMVTMNGANASVTIINQMMNCSGMVRIQKWMETLDGRIIRPCHDEHFEFQLSSRCFENTYTLSKRNDFCVFFDDLEEGTYEVKEVCSEQSVVAYRVNGEYMECANFTLCREDVVVDIINKELPAPCLYVQKRIREQGCLVFPSECDHFDFILKGRNTHELYRLHADNNWCVCIRDLCNQHYEIKEIDQDCHTVYKIDDCIREDGYFLFEDKDMEITIINEERKYPKVCIMKLIEDDFGNYVKPCPEQEFEIIIEGDCYKQCFNLCDDHDFSLTLDELPCGTYTIRELDCTYEAEFRIDDNVQRDGTFCLKDEDVHIVIINREPCHNALSFYAYEVFDGREAMPQLEQEYRVKVTHEGQMDTFVLDCNNDWCICLEDICCGEYHIQSDVTEMLYEIEGRCFEQGIDVCINCDDHKVIKLLDERCVPNTIEIQKYMVDANGKRHRPQCGAIYEVELHGEYNDCFQLSDENDYAIRLEEYPMGIYEVREVGGCLETQYQINDEEPVSQGYFTLKHKPITISILNPLACPVEPKPTSGSLTVHAMVENCDGELETAPSDASFDVMIDGDNVQEDITLNHRNGFQMVFDQLPRNQYTISQKPNNDYGEIRYRVNGIVQSNGEICLGEDDIQVDIINHMHCGQGSIRIMKYQKDEACGCLKRPCMEEEYEVELIGNAVHETMVLNAANKWAHVFEDLVDGEYQIIEKNGGDNVTYIVNGGKEERDACIRLHGEEANVKIINASHEDKPKGSIELCKLMKDATGRYQYPDKDASYWVKVEGMGHHERILLHSANHFFVEIRGLVDGVYEVSEEDGDHVMYTVNGGSEQAKAIVHVTQNTNAVNIINGIQSYGEMKLTKYLRAATGELQRPIGSQVYRVHVSRPGYNKVVILDDTNDFQVILRDLQQGMYVVDELDHEHVSYCIDGGTEVDRAIVHVQNNDHEVSIINSSIQRSGSIKMTKFMRNTTGQLTRPSNDMKFQFHISKPGYNEVVTLDDKNNWIATLQNLSDGNYVIAEINSDTKVSYVINDGSETDFGIVSVTGNENTVHIINAVKPSENGSITITKYMRSGSGELIRPTGGFQTKVHVSKPGYNEVFTLHQANDWSISLLDLMDGQYVLTEVDNEDDVTWRINGGYEVRYAVVDVNHNQNQVDMIDTASTSGGAIQLNKFMRNASGQLVRPTRDESFDIRISGPQSRTVTLNVENHWSVKVDDLMNGTYQIRELNAGNYDVSYIVNDGEETTSASVTLRDDEQSVGIINASKGARNQLEIMKYTKGSNGTLMPPASGDRYVVEVNGENFRETFTLDESNRFTVRISNLVSGTYSVKEMSGEEYVTTYRVNGGQETSSAIIQVSNGKNNVVEVINELIANQNTLDVFKYIMDANGNFVKPDSSLVFRFLITGSNYHQFYTLSSDNDWHVVIDTLASGEYEVIEQSSSQYRIQYLVNGADFSDTAEFTAFAGAHNIVEIVNQNIGGEDGVLRLEKKVRTTEGNLINPGNGESFQIRVVSKMNNYDETFTLDELNGYMIMMNNLVYGQYEIMEIDNSGYGITYIVNDGREESSALLDIENANANNIMIINTQTDVFFDARKTSDIHIVIE